MDDPNGMILAMYGTSDLGLNDEAEERGWLEKQETAMSGPFGIAVPRPERLVRSEEAEEEEFASDIALLAKQNRSLPPEYRPSAFDGLRSDRDEFFAELAKSSSQQLVGTDWDEPIETAPLGKRTKEKLTYKTRIDADGFEWIEGFDAAGEMQTAVVV